MKIIETGFKGLLVIKPNVFLIAGATFSKVLIRLTFRMPELILHHFRITNQSLLKEL